MSLIAPLPAPTLQPAAPEEPAKEPPPPPPKKAGRRKPVWVLIRPEVTDVGEGNLCHVYKCTGVEEVRTHLTRHFIDASNIGKRVTFLRADPVEVTIKNQLLIKF